MLIRPRYSGPKVPTSYAVSMTAAASGSNGIAVADDDSYDFGTGDFTVFWEGDFFDFDAAVHLMSKLSGGVYVELIVLNSQIMRLAVNGDAGSPDAVQSTATVPSAKGFYAATYESGSPNATVRFYYNGQKLGADVATASHGNLSNAGAQVISGRTVPGIRELSNTIRAGILNFKLSDAQVAQLYSSGIPAEWMWGSNVSLNLSAWQNNPGVPYTVFSGASSTGYHAENDGSGNALSNIDDAINYEAGIKYRVRWVASVTGQFPQFVASTNTDGAPISADGTRSGTMVNGVNVIEFTPTVTVTGSFVIFNLSGATTDFDIAEFEIIRLGATLALLPETLPTSGALEWPDSANGNDGTLPAAGATKVTIRK